MGSSGKPLRPGTQAAGLGGGFRPHRTRPPLGLPGPEKLKSGLDKLCTHTLDPSIPVDLDCPYGASHWHWTLPTLGQATPRLVAQEEGQQPLDSR